MDAYGPSVSDDAYVHALEKQCQDWENMYNDLKRECEGWKERALNAEMHKESLAQKLEVKQQQLRHV